MDQFDICIIGAGVVGLAIARKLSQQFKNSKLEILLVEANDAPGQEISSRNSEVIHAGIYYPPGSLKAELCVNGKKLLYDYCNKYSIPYNRLGKFLIAQKNETERLEKISANALKNGVDDLSWISTRELREAEPEVDAYQALFSPSTGIIDSHSYMTSLLNQAEIHGVCFAPLTKVIGIRSGDQGFVVHTRCGKNGEQEFSFVSRQVINCAGLEAQRIAGLIEGIRKQVIPDLHLCKGEYFSLKGKNPFSHLIYPMPEANQTGLGVHATLDLGNQVKFGPNVQYLDSINYQVENSSLESFYRAIKNYYPKIKMDDLQPAYAGIRPKLQGPGEEFRDFMIQGEEEHSLRGLTQLFGIESPGLTASLAIADRVYEKVKLST